MLKESKLIVVHLVLYSFGMLFCLFVVLHRPMDHWFRLNSLILFDLIQKQNGQKWMTLKLTTKSIRILCYAFEWDKIKIKRIHSHTHIHMHASKIIASAARPATADAHSILLLFPILFWSKWSHSSAITGITRHGQFFISSFSQKL